MEEKSPTYTSATPSQLPLPHKHLNLKTTFLFVLAAMVINSLYLLEVMHALRPNGSENNGIISLLFGMFLIIALLMAIYFSLGLFKKKTRSQSAKFLAASIFFLIFAAGTLKLSAHMRRDAFSSFTERSKPLIQAIEDYQGRHGEPPDSLEQLVPDFLPAIPPTGLGGCPAYVYKKLPANEDKSPDDRNYYGNPWVFHLPVRLVPMNWDSFLYFPMQNYPSTGYGGLLEKIGDWAYVHE